MNSGDIKFPEAKPIPKSSLGKFLESPKYSHAREALITTRVIHDLMTAGAAHGVNLLAYTPVVDSEGFDLVLDDHQQVAYIQLKSVLFGCSTSGWSIHRRFLRPDPFNSGELGFSDSESGEGRGGGVVLIEIEPNEAQLNINYFYTDVRIVFAFAKGWIPALAKTQQRLQNLLRDLEKSVDGKVRVPRSAFLRPRSVEHLLALIGLQCRMRNVWINYFQFSTPYNCDGRERSTEDQDKYRPTAMRLLNDLVVHTDLEKKYSRPKD